MRLIAIKRMNLANNQRHKTTVEGRLIAVRNVIVVGSIRIYNGVV